MMVLKDSEVDEDDTMIFCGNNSTENTVRSQLSNITRYTMIYGILGIASTLLYLFFLYTKVDKSRELNGGLDKRPSYISLIVGKKDDWIKEFRGEAALSYLRFQRLIILQALLVVIFSTVSFLINNTQREAEAITIIFTASPVTGSLKNDPPAQWTIVVASALIPVSLLFSIIWMFGDVSMSSSSLTSTVFVNGLDPCHHSAKSIKDYVKKVYPSFNCTSIQWARSTVRLRKVFRQFKRTQECIECFRTERYFNREGLSSYKLKQSRLESKFICEKNLSRSSPLPIVFITFETHQQAVRFTISESLDYRSLYR